MSTGLIIALIVIAAVAVLAAAFTLGARRSRRGPALRRRFGPEYDVTVARHDGDTRAAERELAMRLERHGDLRRRPLEPAEREQYEARWTAAQERFVESPRDAVAEADRLLADLAGARGYPGSGQYEEQLAALSVHHAHYVDGYRRVHRAARAHTGGVMGPDLATGFATPGTGFDSHDTEEMREAMVAARALFDELLVPARADSRAATPGHSSARSLGRPADGGTPRHTRPARGTGRRDLSSALRARLTKEG